MLSRVLGTRVLRVVWASILLCGCSTVPSYVPFETLKSPLELPLHRENQTVLVDAKLDGVPVRLMVDFGSAESISLRPGRVDHANLRYTGESHSIYNALGKRVEAREFVVSKLQLGAGDLAGVPGSVGFDGAVVGTGKAPEIPADGHLGMGFFSAFGLVHLNVPDGRCVLYPKGVALPEEFAHWPFRILTGGDGLTFSAGAKGHSVSVILDTGATYSVLRPGVAKRLSLPIDADRPLTELPIEIAHAVELKLGCYVYDLESPKEDVLLGYNFFQAVVVLVDLENARVYFAP